MRPYETEDSMIRRIVSLLSFRSKQSTRAVTTPTPPNPKTGNHANGGGLHPTPNADLAALPQSAPPITPAENIKKEPPPKKVERSKTDHRSPHASSPSPSEHKRIRDLEKQMDKLRRENAYLRQLLAAAKTEKRAQTDESDDAENGTAYDRLLAAYDLPRKTAVSKGGWVKELQIIYSQERDAFCDSFQKKYTEKERGRFAKAIRLFAQEGPQRMHNSLETKILRREITGTPRDANYSRASHEHRFTWKQIGDEILMIFNAYKHTSGHAHTLNSVK